MQRTAVCLTQRSVPAPNKTENDNPRVLLYQRRRVHQRTHDLHGECGRVKGKRRRQYIYTHPRHHEKHFNVSTFPRPPIDQIRPSVRRVAHGCTYTHTSPFRISRTLCTGSVASFIDFEFRPGELFPLEPLAATLKMGGVCMCSLFSDTHCCSPEESEGYRGGEVCYTGIQLCRCFGCSGRRLPRLACFASGC